jgi:hypothetical protein
VLRCRQDVGDLMRTITFCDLRDREPGRLFGEIVLFDCILCIGMNQENENVHHDHNGLLISPTT